MIRVEKTSVEYRTVAARFLESCGGSKQIVAVMRVVNERTHVAFLQYFMELASAERKRLSRPKDFNVALLFHGARSMENTMKIVDGGFDFRLCGGVSGRGVYFASDAKYSVGGIYAARVDTWDDFANVEEFRSCKCVFAARVVLGRVSNSQADSRTVRPPEGYDSVLSCDRNYVVFDNRAALPEFLVIFRGASPF